MMRRAVIPAFVSLGLLTLCVVLTVVVATPANAQYGPYGNPVSDAGAARDLTPSPSPGPSPTPPTPAEKTSVPPDQPAFSGGYDIDASPNGNNNGASAPSCEGFGYQAQAACEAVPRANNSDATDTHLGVDNGPLYNMPYPAGPNWATEEAATRSEIWYYLGDACKSGIGIGNFVKDPRDLKDLKPGARAAIAGCLWEVNNKLRNLTPEELADIRDPNTRVDTDMRADVLGTTGTTPGTEQPSPIEVGEPQYMPPPGDGDPSKPQYMPPPEGDEAGKPQYMPPPDPASQPGAQSFPSQSYRVPNPSPEDFTGETGCPPELVPRGDPSGFSCLTPEDHEALQAGELNWRRIPTLEELQQR